jgi:protein-tyrosine phosphatase
MSRVIDFEGIVNARDLGGAAAAGGQRVAAGRLFRSGSPHEMTDADRAALEAMGVGVILDLRAGYERSRDPYDWPGRVVPVTLVADARVEEVHRRFADGSITEAELEDWWAPAGVFRAPEDHAAGIGLVFRTLLESEAGVLFHCRTGKDRTGLVAALILSALGVPREEVLADFLLSNEGLAGFQTRDLERIKQTGIGSYGERARFSLTGVRAEWLERLLGDLSRSYGSVPGYLEARAGFGPDQVRRLRRRYLVGGR